MTPDPTASDAAAPGPPPGSTPSPDLTTSDAAALLAFDRDHVWHPYSSALTPQEPYLVESAHGIRLRLRDRDGAAARGGRRDGVVVVRHPRVRRARARRRRAPAAGVDVARDVRRADPRAGGRAGPPARRPGTGGARARLPGRLGVGVGRGRDEDGPAVAPRGRAAAHPVLHDPGRLPRRHLLADVGDRPGRRDARAVPRGAARARLRTATAGWDRPRTATTPRWSPGSARPARCMPRTPTRWPP